MKKLILEKLLLLLRDLMPYTTVCVPIAWLQRCLGCGCAACLEHAFSHSVLYAWLVSMERINYYLNLYVFWWPEGWFQFDKSILLSIYRMVYCRILNTMAYRMFHFCYQRLYIWKMIGNFGKQECTRRKMLVSSWQVSPGGRPTAHITFHQERGKMGILTVLCAFITSTA